MSTVAPTPKEDLEDAQKEEPEEEEQPDTEKVELGPMFLQSLPSQNIPLPKGSQLVQINNTVGEAFAIHLDNWVPSPRTT